MEPIRRPETCLICFRSHHLRDCTIFRTFSVTQRIYTASVHKYCINCLSQTHLVSRCNSRPSCLKCSQKYHTLLHRGRPVRNSAGSVQDRLQLGQNRRLHERIVPPPPVRRLQRPVRREMQDGSCSTLSRASDRDSGIVDVSTSRQRRSRRRATMLQRQLEAQAADQATTHQLLREVVATMGRLSEAILVAPVQGRRHVQARTSSIDDDLLDIEM